MTAIAWETIREIGLRLPNTELGTAWGTPVLRVKGRIFAGIPIHKSAEPHSLMVHVDVADRDVLIEEQPQIYYTAAHYENYPCVLVRLSRIRRDALADLLRMGHQSASRAKTAPKRASRSRARTRRER